MRIKILTIAIIALTAVSTLANDPKVESDIRNLRKQVVTAIKAKDQKFLEGRLVEQFTHTHASGKVDDKQTRIAMLMSDPETIDALEPVSISIKAFEKDLAVAQGRTRTFGASPKAYQWTVVYRKIGGIWRILLSHASPVVE